MYIFSYAHVRIKCTWVQILYAKILLSTQRFFVELIYTTLCSRRPDCRIRNIHSNVLSCNHFQTYRNLLFAQFKKVLIKLMNHLFLCFYNLEGSRVYVTLHLQNYFPRGFRKYYKCKGFLFCWL